MTDPATLHAAVLTALEAMPTVTAYDGDVPPSPPADAQGRVYPYAVLWPSPGADPVEVPLGCLPTELDWTAQVTVAAGNPTWCLQAIPVVRRALVGLVPVPGAARITDQTPRSRLVTRDPDTNPPRWFVPLLFGCVTS